MKVVAWRMTFKKGKRAKETALWVDPVAVPVSAYLFFFFLINKMFCAAHRVSA